MDAELKHFNKVNANLGLIVDDLRMKQEGLSQDNKIEKEKYRLEKAKVDEFSKDLEDIREYIQDPKKLKESFIILLNKWSQEENHVAQDADATSVAEKLTIEFENQRK